MSVIRLRKYGSGLDCDPIINDNYVIKSILRSNNNRDIHLPVPDAYFYRKNFSLDFWVYPKNVTDEYQHYIVYQPLLGTTGTVFRLYTRSIAKMYLQWGDEAGGWTSAGWRGVNTDNSLNVNAWNYIGFSFLIISISYNVFLSFQRAAASASE